MRRRRRRKGFTLVELLVVVTIIGLLVGIMTVAIPKRITKARATTTQAQIAQLKSAIYNYHLDTGTFPESLQDLITQPSTEIADTWDGPYLQDTEVLPKDGWNKEFEYTMPGEGGRDFEIVSFGADRQPGGEGYDADIKSWVAKED